MNLPRQRWRALLLSVALSALAYLSFSLWGGWSDVTSAVAHVGWSGATAMLALSTVNYGVRFGRWQLYLRRLGHTLAWRPSLSIYIAGFALTTTPGKAGEAVRGIFLKPLGMGYRKSTAAFLSERLSDLIAIVALACLGLASFPSAWPLVVAGAAAVFALLGILCHPRWLSRWDVKLAGKSSRFGRLLHQVVQLLLDAQPLHTPSVIALSTFLALAAWGAEALAFDLMLGWLGHPQQFTFAVFTYSLSMLAGALSFMPGGLGGTEATMIALLLWAKLPQPHAVAATVLIRLTTLWFAVAIGLLALLNQLRRREVNPDMASAGDSRL